MRLVGYVLLMPGMDQTHGEASIGQHLKHGNPQHPGGFQGYGVDSARRRQSAKALLPLVNDEKPRTGWASRYGYPQLPTDSIPAACGRRTGNLARSLKRDPITQMGCFGWP